LEIEVAARLGDDGIIILNKLAEIDDGNVARLCEAQRDGTLTYSDLSAARLAVQQVQWGGGSKV
jgi:hypothetical protein